VPLKIAKTFVYDLETARGQKTSNALVHHYGFDPKAKFQMIHEKGRTQFSVEGGDPSKLSFKLTPPDICTIVNQDMAVKNLFGSKNGLITIEGAKAGKCELALVNSSSAPIDKIEISVVTFRTVAVRFYNLNGRAPSPPSKQDLDELVDRLNEIVFLQCGVHLSNAGMGLLRDLSAPSVPSKRSGLINVFDSEPGKDFRALNASPDLDRAGAQYHVVFGPPIDGRPAGGITENNVTVLLADLAKDHREVTAAHEFVHFICGSGILVKGDHDGEKSDLMFASFPHGIMMRKERLLKVIH
jgi:hypothetical protein